MALLKPSRLRRKFGVRADQVNLIKIHLQGAVRTWTKDHSQLQPEERIFAARDLLGGENREWQGTPLFCLFEQHRDKGKTLRTAVKEAGKEAGWLLKWVLSEDKRHYETHRKGRTVGYRWVGNEP